MNLKFDFSKILVTGPQRSGTRIVAKMIAHDNGIRYISEQKINIRSGLKVHKFLCQDERFVIQCPGLCHCIENFADEDVLIVIVVRKVEDIIASQNRINWTKRFQVKELRQYGLTSGIISEVRYKHWQQQKKQIVNWIEIIYEDLQNHTLFIPKKERKKFKWNQTERIHKEA